MSINIKIKIGLAPRELDSTKTEPWTLQPIEFTDQGANSVKIQKKIRKKRKKGKRMSHSMCPVSSVTCHLSHVTCNL